MPDPILTATPDETGLIWTTSQFDPTDYSGDSYSQNFRVVPSSGNSFPVTTATATVTASDDNGPDQGTGTVISQQSNVVTVGVTITNTNGLGPNMNFTAVLTFAN